MPQIGLARSVKWWNTREDEIKENMAKAKLPWITQGFREDCSRLIARFEKLETVRFDGFCEIWREMKMPLVYAGRRSLIELIEFCEDTLIVAKEFFLPPLSFKERIGGLYLLYALYFKMPIEGPKIRIKLEDWQDIIEIHAELGQAEHHDASYILATLLSKKAFAFCMLDRELGLESSYRLKVPTLRNTFSVLSDIREMAGPHDLFDRIKILGKSYKEKKAEEMGRFEDADGSDKATSHLDLYDCNFGAKLINRVNDVERNRKLACLGIFCATGDDERGKNDNSDKTKNDGAKKKPAGSDPIRSRLGHGFDTDSSESEIEEIGNPSERRELPDIFDDSSLTE